MNPYLGLPIPQRGKPSYHDRAPFAGSSRNITALKIRNALSKVRQKYVYSRLEPNKTRLLILYPPGNGPERLEVELEEVAFDDLGSAHGIPYEALSYHWGPDQDVKPLYVRNEASGASYHESTLGTATTHINSLTTHDPREQASPVTQAPGSSSVASYMPEKRFQQVASTLLEKKLYVKTNCYNALRQLRSHTQAIKLWVDVICIDQSDNREKEEQVSQMVQIYSKADRVLIWLGDDDRRSRNAFSFIREFVQVEDLDSVVSNQRTFKDWGDLVYLMENRWFSRRWVIQEMAYAKEAMLYVGDRSLHWDDFRDAVSLFVLNIDKIKNLIQPLLNLSVGVRDDAVFAKLDNSLHNLDFLLHTNLDSLPAKVFIDVLDYMFRKPKNEEDPRPLYGLEYLVSSLYIYENADPRDTIHALFNIASETYWKRRDRTGPMPPKPSYGKNLLEIYAGFVKWVVLNTGSLDILCRKWAVPERKQEPVIYPNPIILPSWIGVVLAPEKERRGIKNASFVGLPDNPQYNASQWAKARTIFGIDISDDKETSPAGATKAPNGSGEDVSVTTGVNRLGASEDNSDLLEKEVRTVRFKDKIFTALSLGSWARDNLTFQFNMATYQRDRDASLFVQGLQVGEITWATDPITDGVIPSAALVMLRENTHQAFPDRLWKTLVAERGPDGRNPPPWYYRACRYCLENHTPNGMLNTEKLLTQSLPNIVRAFLRRVHDVTWNRRFIQMEDESKNEWCGLAPSQARHGDLLCILFGCSVPCVLRRHRDRDGNTHYSFVGESYIYGLMDGEAVSGLEQEHVDRKSRVFRLL